MSDKTLVYCNNLNTVLDRGKIWGIDLEIPEGMKVCVLGAKGSGKSVLLRTLAGFYANFNGTAEINGNPVGRESKKDVSFIPDVDAFPYQLDIAGNIEIYKLFYEDFDENKLHSILDERGISVEGKLKGRPAEELEWISLAFMFSRNAKVYLIDYPRDGSEISNRVEVKDFIKKYMPKDSVLIYTTTYVSDITDFADSILVLDKGTVEGFSYTEDYVRDFGSLTKLLDYIYQEEEGDYDE